MQANQAVVTDLGGEHLDVKTLAGKRFRLTPVPMVRMPSASPSDWLEFQRAHVAGTEMSPGEIAKIQLFMVAHRTEALSDGEMAYTVAGNRLAYCEPSAIK